MSIFSSVLLKKPGRNKFDLGYTNTLSMNMGALVPVLCKDLVPGDKFRIGSQFFCRTMPMLSPAFGNVRATLHYFFVPYRLVWKNWEDFITGGEDGQQKPAFPYLSVTEGLQADLVHEGVEPIFGRGTLADYLGLYSNGVNRAGTDLERVTSLRHRAYALIWNEWYRDQNVDYKIQIDTSVDGMDPLSPVTVGGNFRHLGYGLLDAQGNQSGKYWRGDLLRRRFYKDYFTSALPWPYRGDDVTLPFAAQDLAIVSDATVPTFAYKDGGRPEEVALAVNTDSELVDGSVSEGYLETGSKMIFDHTGLKATLSNVTSATINDLRRAVSLQRFFELSARGGNRYIEQILSHFGVHSKDARLQRPEFLGGGITPLRVGEVLQTSQTTSDSPQGNMAGRGFAMTDNNNGCTYYATEHGMIMAIMSIIPDAHYFQGIDVMTQKFDRLDYYWPSFAHLGEQMIKKKELVYTGTSADNELFGYAPRYAEYKHSRNELHGDFIPSKNPDGSVTAPLDGWTWARRFEGSTALTSEFLEVPNIENPFAVQDNGKTDKFVFDIYHKIDALRPMPFYGDPRLI